MEQWTGANQGSLVGPAEKSSNRKTEQRTGSINTQLHHQHTHLADKWAAEREADAAKKAAAR